MSFSSLKKQSTNYDDLRSKIKDQGQGYTPEETFWPGIDAAHNGYAVVRFMPAEDAINHIVQYQKWNYKKGSKTYNNKSRRSIGQDDPCQEYRTALYHLNDESRMEIKKKNLTVGYVYVVEDRIKPEQNGKVLKFYMPQAVKKALQEAVDPQKDPFGETPKPFNPFDIYNGRNFLVRVKAKDGNNNYEDSKFLDEVGPWLEDETKMETLWTEGVKPLNDIIDEKTYKPYDELLKQLVEVVGRTPLMEEVFGDKLDGPSESSSSSEEPKSEEKTETDEKPKEEKSEAEKKAAAGSSDMDDDFTNFDFD